ncbi:hypothetical protein Nepgr_005428 [Nepenthes gracilis]|uniref:Uncharacterized protein n=1 Tax=Nepenthes gracilis TaxID=150966 RepID=A0AAD3S361_NEPGR|nr:hypothetical protein Nepgr_005428 [Nepenthes gracilis]
MALRMGPYLLCATGSQFLGQTAKALALRLSMVPPILASSETQTRILGSLPAVCSSTIKRGNPTPTSTSPLGIVSERRRSVSTGATTHVNDPGSIDSSSMQSMEKKIKEQLNAESVTVEDAYGDGRHVSISVVSSAFEGQSAVNRQRMVYKAIWEELQSTVHAVDQMITKTPTEAAGNK